VIYPVDCVIKPSNNWGLVHNVCVVSCRKESSQQQIVVPVTGIPYQLSTYQLTEENTDFSYRDKRHQSSMVTSIGPQWTSDNRLTWEEREKDGMGWVGRVLQTPWNKRYLTYLWEYSELALPLRFFPYFCQTSLFHSTSLSWKRGLCLSSIYCLSCWVLWNAYESRFKHIENKLLDIYEGYIAEVYLLINFAPGRQQLQYALCRFQYYWNSAWR